jgi:hypothetical protein
MLFKGLDASCSGALVMQASVTYKFSQRLNAPAKVAYRWCTDYQPSDLSLMHEKGQRRIRWMTSDTVILREVVSYNGKRTKKVKLVKLDPTHLSWYNIQLSGPNKHSAFLYRIVPEGKNRSRLDFTGLLVVYSQTALTNRKLGEIARTERRYDSNAWKHLAKALYNQTIRIGR